jgi:hypothetical protein
METEGPSPCLQEPATGPQMNPIHTLPPINYIHGGTLFMYLRLLLYQYCAKLKSPGEL